MYRLQNRDTEGIRGLGYEYGYITSTDTVTEVSVKFRKERNANKNRGRSIQHNTNNTYENGDRCVQIWKRREMCFHVYIHTCRMQNNKHADRKGGQTYEQGHAYNKSTVPKICIEFEGNEEREKGFFFGYKYIWL